MKEEHNCSGYQQATAKRMKIKTWTV